MVLQPTFRVTVFGSLLCFERVSQRFKTRKHGPAPRPKHENTKTRTHLKGPKHTKHENTVKFSACAARCMLYE